MKLQDALFISRKSFISKISSIIEEMRTLNSSYIQEVLNEVILFNEKFKEAAINEHEKFQAILLAPDAEELIKEYDQTYVQIMIDFQEAETLPTLLETFKEATENKINNYESIINTDISKDWKETEQRIIQDQHTRNRDII